MQVKIGSVMNFQKYLLIIKRFVKNTICYRSFVFVRSIKLLKKWDESNDKALAFYSSFLKPGDLCFDIGANIGMRTKVFRKCGAKVVAFEPQEICLKILRSFFRNDYQVIIMPYAIAAEDGVSTIFIADGNTISSMSQEWINRVSASRRFGYVQWNNQCKINTMSLNSVIQQFGIPKFVKIDVEGYEFEVLKNLSTPLPMLSFEFTPEYIENTQKIINLLDEIGTYQYNLSIGESMKLFLTEWVDCETIFETLIQFQQNNRLWADVYARYLGKPPNE